MSETRTRIKICGITNGEDARAAVDYGADALGFIMVPESPRFVRNADCLVQIIRGVPPFVGRVAVMRDASNLDCLPTDDAEDLFDTFQLYDNTCWPSNGDARLVFAARIRDCASLDQVDTSIEWDALLLDTFHKDKLGGSGETFNWDLAVEAKERFGKPIILAGGLTPENVGEAIAKVRPYAVDVSSGVEAEPGRKDHAKLKAFIRAVREADRLLDT
jgi:phosphoribosylanthranilate isomerase